MAWLQRRTTSKGDVRYDVHWMDDRQLNSKGMPTHRSKVFRRSDDAKRFLKELEAGMDRGDWVSPSGGRAAFRDFARSWLASKRPHLAQRTVEVYDSLLTNHLEPYFGGMQLSRITATEVREWFTQMSTKAGAAGRPLTPATLAKTYRLLNQILGQAQTERLIPSNPCLIKGATAERSPERPVASIGEVFQLAEVVAARYRALILLAAFSGLRLGELRALRRRDVDLARHTLNVTASISELQSGRLVRKDVKTAAGRRVVTMPDVLVPVVEQHVALYVGASPDADLFTSPTGGPFRGSNFRRQWLAARACIGREDLHFHDLRHTANTLAAMTGASTRELMERMGHASPRAAIRYQHLARSDQHIADGLSALIETTQARHKSEALAAEVADGRGQELGKHPVHRRSSPMGAAGRPLPVAGVARAEEVEEREQILPAQRTFRADP